LTGVHLTLRLYDRGLGFGVDPAQMYPLFTVAGTNSITGFDPANVTVVFADTPNWATNSYNLSIISSGGNTALALSGLAPVPEPTGCLLAATALALVAGSGRRLWRRSAICS